MIEKSSFQHSDVSSQRSNFQPSALSCRLFTKAASRFAKDELPEAAQPELTNTPPPCRIVCDETPEDFRLTLCRTLCAGACPKAQDLIRENPRKSVAAFLKAES
jgi:hypothetical protein